LKRSDYLTSVFHTLIIAIFLLSLNGCGYKAAPYYQEVVPKSDKNVEFILQKKSFPDKENNQSCE